ncbi:MAG: OsmC family protein [Bacteroidales bacterium]|nr:OsmC family protein [Bacteroidales bacterium]MCF8403465.1 OsmC family protein [Bacteroidales bacterium]
MDSVKDLGSLTPDHIFDGGDMDCGSGLVLLIRENMKKVPVGGIMEMRSREPSVCDDLPPWCRMVGHDYLGIVGTPGQARYFIRKNLSVTDNKKTLEEDKQKAKNYEWRLRTRSTGHLKSTVYCRNFSFDVGQAASFEEKDKHPSALEYLVGALAASLSTSFSTESAKAGLDIDDVEISIRCQLDNILAHLGLEEGYPGISSVNIKCFITSMDDAEKIRAVWSDTLKRSPLYATLEKCTSITTKMNIV